MNKKIQKIFKFNKQELNIQIPSFPPPTKKKKTFFESTFEYCIVLIKKDLKTKKTKSAIGRQEFRYGQRRVNAVSPTIGS